MYAENAFVLFIKKFWIEIYFKDFKKCYDKELLFPLNCHYNYYFI